MEQENRPKIKKLVKSWKGKLSQNQSQIRNTCKVMIRQNIDKHECNNKIFVDYTASNILATLPMFTISAK